VLDEALVWAAKSGRVEAIRLLVELGARADPNQRGTFGGPSHGDGVPAINVAAQAGRRDAVIALLELGADPLITDRLHGGSALGWARVGGHPELAEVLP
jgi:ankyrin repeat protein